MRDFLVQVDSSGDVPGFKRSMSDWDIAYRDGARDQEWIDERVPQGRRPVDARYFVVKAESRDAIFDAVEKTERYMRDKWHEGGPVFSVLDDREPPSYPAPGAEPDDEGSSR